MFCSFTNKRGSVTGGNKGVGCTVGPGVVGKLDGIVDGAEEGAIVGTKELLGSLDLEGDKEGWLDLVGSELGAEEGCKDMEGSRDGAELVLGASVGALGGAFEGCSEVVG